MNEPARTIIENLVIALKRRIPGCDPGGEAVGDAAVLLMAENWLQSQGQSQGQSNEDPSEIEITEEPARAPEITEITEEPARVLEDYIFPIRR